MNLNEQDILTVEQVAALLNLKKSRIYHEVFHKRLPHFKIRRSLRFKKSELLEWFSAQSIAVGGLCEK